MTWIHDAATAVLRRPDPEIAHRLSLQGLAWGLGPRHLQDDEPSLAIDLAGLTLANAVGLAAGFDKDAEVADRLLSLGFGFVECGTVTPLPQAGNPRPRLFRLPADRAVINRMGFNNAGLDRFAGRLGRMPSPRAGPVGANVGANKESADRVADYVIGLRRLWPLADYFTLNVSSPNTPGLRELQQKTAMEELLGAVAEARASLSATHGQRPVFLKIAPDLSASGARDILETAVANGLDGLIVSNTTLARPASLVSPHRAEDGGLSGAPLFEPSTALLRDLFAEAGGRLVLIGAGGVGSGAEAYAKIRAGARAVQLYTALAYEGPGLVRRIKRELAARLRADGFVRLKDAVGAG